MPSPALKLRHSGHQHATVFTRYRNSIKDLYTIVHEARKGVQAKAFFDIVSLSGHDKNEVADLLNISLKTLIRYQQQGKKLTPTKSERVLKLIALYKKGQEIFGNVEEFRKWLEEPAYGLNNLVPYDLMQTSGGIDLITEELMRIEYGDLA